MIHVKCLLDKDVNENGHPCLHQFLSIHRWPNILLSGFIESLCGHDQRKRSAFVNACEQSLRKRTFGTNEKFDQAIFCECAMEEAHVFIQNFDGSWHRKIFVIQNIIIKWMYAIYIPFEKRLVRLLPEIEALTRKDSYNFTSEELDSLIDKTWTHMIECGIILKIESYSKDSTKSGTLKNRCVLHGSVRRYLAHKRGLSLEKADNRELNSVSLSPVLIDGGPMLNSQDYLETRALFDRLIKSEPETMDRLQIRSAYALMRGNLYAQSAMRAGVSNMPSSSRDSVLHAHVRRLSRLRTASENQLRIAFRVGSSPALYAHDRVWLLNEIGVVRYIQGNFHDCVLLFRQALKYPSLNQHLKDDTIKSRIYINLCLALIERARFEEALSCLQSAQDHLVSLCGADEEISRSSLKQHPEYILIQKLIYGCRAQVHYVIAEIDLARSWIKRATLEIEQIHTSAARGWLYHIDASIHMATGNYPKATEMRALALANARAAHRHDLILSMEISEIELELRARNFDREPTIRSISLLSDVESKAVRLGSHKIRVSAMLIRGRALLTIEQTESARKCIIGAICLAQHNGMRLKRISGLILMVALIAMRGERVAALGLLGSVRLAASRAKYARALLEIELLEHAINAGASIPQWAGYVAEYARTDR